MFAGVCRLLLKKGLLYRPTEAEEMVILNNTASASVTAAALETAKEPLHRCVRGPVCRGGDGRNK